MNPIKIIKAGKKLAKKLFFDEVPSNNPLVKDPGLVKGLVAGGVFQAVNSMPDSLEAPTVNSDYSKALIAADNQRVGKLYDIAEAANASRLMYTPDYSYQLAALGGDSISANGLGHFTDKGKLPNHPTFSTEALLGTPETAGLWSHGPVNEGRLGDIFTPSAEQLKTQGYIDKLQQYYSTEKGRGIDKVSIPGPYRQVR